MSEENFKEEIIVDAQMDHLFKFRSEFPKEDEGVLSHLLSHHWREMRKLIDVLYKERRKNDPCFLLIKEIRDRGMVSMNRISDLVAEIEKS